MGKKKNPQDEFTPTPCPIDITSLTSLFGTFPSSPSESSATTAYLVKSIPGLIVIPNPFTPAAQRYLVKQCLRELTARPNVTNLDTHFVIPDEGVWNVYESSITSSTPESHVLLRRKPEDFPNSSDDERYTEPTTTPTTPTPPSTTTKILIDPPTTATPFLKPLLPFEAIHQLRWTSLGYQYNWSTKEYHLDRRPPFPTEIADISQAVVQTVQHITGYDVNKWKSEAGIVNYYQLKDSLTSHQDRSELNTEAPLVSFRLVSALSE
ncbi:Nucleic acid dioxygenase alkbh1 [Rhizophlyctis rosea]|uniref:Nucleic acid dioxygenase alkbh1 n=1 Tax=Rhizophlyctis rosea TaxID=64517 RepID=A0AAD5X5Y0_9FUNG|nr:Nucleic acid dioxygenase alkbh1 [Rhizophlyctis rosea]